MSMIQLKSNYPHNYISVPHVFIDNYMADANGEFVKVYLYLLRCINSSKECSISAIADHVNNTEKDILRALKYWEKVGVLHLEINEQEQLTGLTFLDLTADIKATTISQVVSKDPQTTTDAKSVSPKKTSSAKNTNTIAIPEKREYTLDEIKVFQNNHEISELLFIIEAYLKHPLASTEMNSVFFWYDVLKFPVELIEYLVEYCITNGHSSLRYMDKVALSWSEKNIHTVEKAKEQASIHSKTYYSIMKAFGISGRNLADSEMAYVNKWSNEYAFDIELIQEACKRTISATQKPSFEYADSILTKWHKNHVHNMKDIEFLDEAFNRNKRAAKPVQPAKHNKFNNFEQRTYDSAELEKILLTTSIQ